MKPAHMKIVRWIVSGVAIVFVVLLVVAYLLPRHALVTRTTAVAAPPAAVFPLVGDLRRFNEVQQQHLPVYADSTTAAVLRDRFAYTFVDAFSFYGGKPDLHLHEVTGPFEALGQHIVPIPVLHGRLPISGYRIGNLAYVTDAKTIPAESLELLEGLDVLVLNGLREREHPTHLSFGEAVQVIQKVKPRRAYLVHLSHETSHEQA